MNETPAVLTESPAAPGAEPDNQPVRKHAMAMAHSLGIAVYVRDGRIHHRGPGERFEPARRHPADLDAGFRVKSDS